MTITVLGIYCREDKEGVFFLVNGKKKKDLWPLIKEQTDPETTFVYTDSAKSYHNVDELFDDAIHMTVNHKKGEFVDRVVKDNHINSIENQNKLLKKRSSHIDL
ncbi:hypothetical protein JTE90_029151 [Oedothorax gibbosus]|uniref:ISXO2-like transposase domain-containing protein n=1 Tax=Oedothorax gibbosus TaxID=931172 RepID=A0AAV6UB82_9ARAC|nr:hypothetical protein JTE90_029151 [Oedothorax gibbosus]